MAPPADIEATAKLKAGSYDGDALWQEETQRDTKRQNLVQEYRARFINGALLILPQHHLSVQFDPRNLQPLEDVGIVYPSLRVIDDWGILEANKGALMKKGKSAVVVEAPTSIAGKSIEGNGWTLELSPQWSVVPAARKGDFTVQRQEPGAPKVPMKP